MTLIIVVMDASFYLRYCITLEKPHHGRTQPARRTGVLLRIRPLRHRRQSTQEQQQPRRRMDVRLPQRPYRRYRHLQYDSYAPLAQECNWTNEDGESGQQAHYFHYDQIGIP